MYLKGMILLIELLPIVEDWVSQEEDEIYECIREKRADILELMQKVPVAEAMQLQIFMNKLNAIEYLLIKGGEK